jgi:hypothetical protein
MPRGSYETREKSPYIRGLGAKASARRSGILRSFTQQLGRILQQSWIFDPGTTGLEGFFSELSAP